MRFLIATLAVLVAALPCAAQPADTLSAAVRQFVEVGEPTVALTGVQVVDGTGSPAASGQTVLIRDGRITAVGPDAEVDVPGDARVLNLPGHTVVPGFVGLHDHTFYMTRGRRVQLNFSAPRLYLASGVTTIRTTGAFSPYSELNLKRSIQEGQEIGPRMFITGPYLSGAGAMSQMFQVSTPEDARRVVAYLGRRGGRLVQGLYPGSATRSLPPPSTRRTGGACGSPATSARSRSGRRWPWASTTSSMASSPTATTPPASSPASARPTCGGACWRSTWRARRWRPPSARWSSRASP